MLRRFKHPLVVGYVIHMAWEKKSATIAADEAELSDLKEKLAKATEFLKWLERWLRPRDWDTRQRVVKALKDIGAWDA